MKYLRKCLPIVLGFILMIQTVQIPRASENRDYLNITMADIIIAWYNASGVAIGYTSILNGIYDTFGNDTLGGLVDNGVIKSNTTNEPEEIKQLIGYGNLTAPTVYVDMERFRFWFTRHPSTGGVKDSLEAMFSSLCGDSGGIQGLACVLGMVANLGKIPYSFEPNTATLVTNENVTNVTSLKNVYNNFVQTNYFQTIIQSTEQEDYLSPYKLLYPERIPTGYRFAYINGNTLSSVYVPQNVYLITYKYSGNYGYTRIYNNNDTSVTVYWNVTNSVNTSTKVINNKDYTEVQTINIGPKETANGYQSIAYNNIYVIGMAVKCPDVVYTKQQAIDYSIEHNPWGTSSGSASGNTEYINSEVGNLNSENYQNANPNITPNEYMYIFNRTSYETIIDTINQNTNNGQYTENGDIINNYNNTYIQDTSTPNVRPSLPPTSGELPAQPFITPRPDLPFEEVEDIIYGGNVPGEIEKKFPFCIPWDIKACIDYFWSPTRKAPHIHWNASFGQWGSLGEIDVDLTPYNTIATIHRALMLIAWIVGLAVLTPKILP